MVLPLPSACAHRASTLRPVEMGLAPSLYVVVACTSQLLLLQAVLVGLGMCRAIAVVRPGGQDLDVPVRNTQSRLSGDELNT